MNKTAIKNFAIWARNKLIADITYKAGLLGITEKDIKSPLPQSTKSVQFFDIGTKEPSSITGHEIEQRKKLVEEIQRKANQSDYSTAYKNVIEEVAYTWFNRLIAIRFMEVNNYLPSRIRVLSSESNGKAEPDLVTHAMEANLDYSAYEKDRIIQLKHENKLDELFRMLFIKQCNALNTNLPELFEKTSDYSELLLNVSFTDKDSVVYHLVNDVAEDYFNVSKEGQVEIIGWLYQYYNTEPKEETFALLKKNIKITKERLPGATQLFTPDWIVRYMVENSLGRLWIEGHPKSELKSNWNYYMDEAEQENSVQKQLANIREKYKSIKPQDIKVIDPAMGSGHILVYAFDVLIQIYESYGYSKRDAAKSILEHNLYGLDIDKRAYQLAYFAVMMKARNYNRNILDGDSTCYVYAIHESNDIDRNQLKYFGAGLSSMEKNTAHLQLQSLLDTFIDATEYGSILKVENYNWELLRSFIKIVDVDGQMSLDSIGVEYTRDQIYLLVEIGEMIARKYDVVITNPPYMGGTGMSAKLIKYIQDNYANSKTDLYSVFIEKCITMVKPNMFSAMITQHGWMFLSSFEKMRRNSAKKTIINMAHLGAKAFDEIGGEVVQTTTFVLCNFEIGNYCAKYSRLVDYTGEKEKERAFHQKENIYLSTQNNYNKIPGIPLAYWSSETIINAFTNAKTLSDIAEPRQGVKTLNNDLFLKYWHEVNIARISFDCKDLDSARESRKKWFPYNKGGSYRKWYGNNDYVVNWENDGYAMKKLAVEKYHSVTRTITNISYFFKPGLTWSSLASGNISLRVFGEGYIFDSKGSSMFFNDDRLKEYILGLVNSKISMKFLEFLAPTLDFNIGPLSKIPVLIDDNKIDKIIVLVNENIKLATDDWNSFETSWDFKKHELITGNSISKAYEKWKTVCEDRFNHLKKNEEEINRIFIEIYGLKDELTPEINDKDVTLNVADLGRDIRSFISYSVGCIFGRYSLDINELAYAGSEWSNRKYNTFIPDKDNILPFTDEEYFKDDIVGMFTKFVMKVYGEETIEENLNFIAYVLDNNGSSSREVIRNYFIKDFFKDHCKVYQKRPIYWLFDSGKQNGFKALIYMHRYDDNTIGNLRIDYLHRMQRIYENEITRMQDTIENSRDAREVSVAIKRKEKLTKQLQETKEYDEKISHLALARTSIDLDDGVKVNYEKVQTGTDGKKIDVLAKI